MKKVININFQGTVVPIEESAYEILQQYIDSLRDYFASEEGHDEIINDIENRISELFQSRIKDGATCITDNDVNVIIDNMGRPKDFDEAGSKSDSEGGAGSAQSSESQTNWQYGQKRLYRDENNKILGGVCSGIAAYLGVDPWLVRILFIISGLGILAYLILWIFLPSDRLKKNGVTKKLYRNPDEKIIAGVCGGIGSYFSINPWIPRIIFLLPFITFLFRWHTIAFLTFPSFLKFTFSPGTLLIYIILWIVIPEARTTSEKLQMKGEKVDLNSIKESVVKEMKGVGERMQNLGKDANKFVKEKGPQISREFGHTVNNSGGAIGRIIVTLFKIFLYIILGSVAFAIIVAVFALAIVAVGIFPLKDFIVTDGLQNILAWLTLIFFIGVPVVGIITSIIRFLTRRKSSNNYFRNIGIGLWIFGWICLFALISFVGRDFKYISSAVEQRIELSNPGTEFMDIVPVRKPELRWKPWLSFEPYAMFNIGDDTAYVPNIRLRIVKSSDTDYHVRYFVMSNGPSREEANRLSALITYGGYQQDSALFLNNEIPVNTHDKFRNQFVDVSVAVPLNRRIKVDEDFISWNRPRFYFFRGPDDHYSGWGTEDAGYDFDPGTEYIMKEDGLHEVNEGQNEESLPNSGYRYRGQGRFDSLKELQERQIQKMEKAIDSTKAAHKKQMQNMQDSLIRQREEIDRKIKNMEKDEKSISRYPDAFPAFFSYI
jgi:phage shock protein PspC (stress-responsive transcriptional regulator)